MKSLKYYKELYRDYSKALNIVKSNVKYFEYTKSCLEEFLLKDNVDLKHKKMFILRFTCFKHGLKFAEEYNITDKEIKEIDEMFENIDYFILQENTNRNITLKDFKRLEKIDAIDAFIKITKKYKSVSSRKIIDALQKLDDIFGHWESGHSMGSCIDFFIKNDFFYMIDNRHYYSSSCRYKETHGFASVTFNNIKELLNLELIKGVPTIRKNNGKCIIFEDIGAKQYWEIKRKEAFLYKDVHSDISYRDAKKTYIKREKALKKKLEDIKLKNFVGIDDFRKTGACDAGINRFLKDIEIDTKKIGGIRIDYLVELAKEKGKLSLLLSYLRRVN